MRTTVMGVAAALLAASCGSSMAADVQLHALTARQLAACPQPYARCPRRRDRWRIAARLFGQRRGGARWRRGTRSARGGQAPRQQREGGVSPKANLGSHGSEPKTPWRATGQSSRPSASRHCWQPLQPPHSKRGTPASPLTYRRQFHRPAGFPGSQFPLATSWFRQPLLQQQSSHTNVQQSQPAPHMPRQSLLLQASRLWQAAGGCRETSGVTSAFMGRYAAWAR